MYEVIDALVPFAVFITIVSIVRLIFGYQYKVKKLKMESIFKVLEKTDEIDPEVIEAIKRDESIVPKDLRRAIMFLGLSLAIAGFSRFLGLLRSPELSDAILGLAFFPGAIAAVYFVFFYLAKK